MITNADIARSVAGGGWLGRYLSHAQSLTRAPLMYHLATGLAVLSVAAGSKVSWRDYGNAEQWANLYVLLLGKSGSGKTTSTTIGTTMLKLAVPGSVIADEFSVEGFINELTNHPSALLYVEEFSTLLTDMNRSYMAPLKPLLTKLYDPRGDYKRALIKEGGTQYIPRPSLSILGGSTTSWLTEHLTEADFRSGFMPRVLLFPQADDDLEEEPDAPTHSTDQMERELIGGLRKVSVMSAANVMFDDDARQFRRDFVEMQRAAMTGAVEDMRGMVFRTAAYVYKVATLLCISDYGVQHQYVVDRKTVRRATILIAWLIQQSREMFERHIVFERFEKSMQSFLECVTEGGVSRGELLRLSRLPAFEFDRLLATAEQRGDVRRGQVRPEGETRAVQVIYRVMPQIYPGMGFVTADLPADDPPPATLELPATDTDAEEEGE